MRLPILLTWLLLWAAIQSAEAQVLPGKYVRDYSPGFSGESLAVSSDSTFVLREWSDVTLSGHPSELYLGAAGVLHQSGTDLLLRYERVLLDTAAWAAREEWSEPVESWAAARLRALQDDRVRLVAGVIDGASVLAWTEDEEHIEACRRQLGEAKPAGDLEALEWQFRREEACGQVFLPRVLLMRIRSGT